ncbi:gp53-like domain-containing protein [Arsenophonus nasoniae]|uniref:Phage tail protein n=1 Tax=Arsenophonus nasoniae TaxID=638 RepID=A0AA95K8M9_9GAMM|nr:hypothetical protein [Arsenophonus nasoniae]WGL96498.1 hypothetical protein QE207_08150 [Arsenophonus nasoniae]
MTVVTEVNSNEYIGNGVTTEFDYKFRVFSDEHLVVTVTDSNGDNERKLTLNSDYTVTGVNSDKGGKIILKSPLVNGNKLLIARDLPAKQEVSFRNQGRFYAEIHENAFDYLTMLIQRVLGNLSLFLKRPSMLSNYFDAKNYRVSNISQPKSDNDAVNFGLMKSAIRDKDVRSLRVNDIDIPVLPDVATRKNKQIGFDANGKPILLDPSQTGALGYVLVDSFEKGFEITARYQALHYEKEGGYYRWDGQLPKLVAKNSTPESTGGIKVGAWMRIVLDSYTKAETDDKFVKLVDTRGVTVAGLNITYGNPRLSFKTTKDNSMVDFVLDPDSKTLNIDGVKSGVGLEYRVQVPKSNGTLALTNNPTVVTVPKLYVTNTTSNGELELTAANKNAWILGANNTDQRLFAVKRGSPDFTVYFPIKAGVLALQGDNYTKSEVDSKLATAKWTASKSTNGWMKDPSTGVIIQWGRVARSNSSRNSFPIAFPSTLAGMGLANFNSNSNLSEMYAPNIMDANNSGFTMRQTKVTTGSNASPFTDMRWIAIGW